MQNVVVPFHKMNVLIVKELFITTDIKGALTHGVFKKNLRLLKVVYTRTVRLFTFWIQYFLVRGFLVVVVITDGVELTTMIGF